MLSPIINVFCSSFSSTQMRRRLLSFKHMGLWYLCQLKDRTHFQLLAHRLQNRTRLQWMYHKCKNPIRLQVIDHRSKDRAQIPINQTSRTDTLCSNKPIVAHSDTSSYYDRRCSGPLPFCIVTACATQK